MTERGQQFREAEEAVGQAAAPKRFSRSWRNWLLPDAKKVNEPQQHLTLHQPSERKAAAVSFLPSKSEAEFTCGQS